MFGDAVNTGWAVGPLRNRPRNKTQMRNGRNKITSELQSFRTLEPNAKLEMEHPSLVSVTQLSRLSEQNGVFSVLTGVFAGRAI